MDRYENFYKKGCCSMNSIVQEAPSISKAIELAWTKAGEPQKFSIRIYEQPEKNFFGMVKKQAKIALLFEKQDVKVKKTTAPKKEISITKNQKTHSKQAIKSTRPTEKIIKQKQEPQKPRLAPEKIKVDKPIANKEEKVNTKKTTEPKKVTEKQKNDVPKPKKLIWSDEMVQVGKKWMEQMLVSIDKKNIQFSVEAKRYHLKFLFESPIAETEEKEKMIFRNSAHLIMQTVRNKFKKQFRYHKVVISSNK